MASDNRGYQHPTESASTPQSTSQSADSNNTDVCTPPSQEMVVNVDQENDEHVQVSLLTSEPCTSESAYPSSLPPPYEPTDSNNPNLPYESTSVNTATLTDFPGTCEEELESSEAMAASAAIAGVYTSRVSQLDGWPPTSVYPPMRHAVTRDADSGDTDFGPPPRIEPMRRLFSILFICGFIGGGLVSLSLQNSVGLGFLIVGTLLLAIYFAPYLAARRRKAMLQAAGRVLQPPPQQLPLPPPTIAPPPYPATNQFEAPPYQPGMLTVELPPSYSVVMSEKQREEQQQRELHNQTDGGAQPQQQQQQQEQLPLPQQQHQHSHLHEEV